MAISDELTLLATTKANIKNSINAKGGSITNETPFSDYATAITNLPSGGDNSTLIDLIERDITSINIPSGTTSIGNNIFSSCSSLTSVTIPNSVTSIGDSAFSSCSSLTSVTIPNSVTSIGQTVFSNAGITSITFPNNISLINNYVCWKCSNLTSVTIPNSATTIGQNAFEFCSSLVSVTIPSSVTEIKANAFKDCSHLTYVAINATTPPTLANYNAFYNTRNCPIYVPAASVDAYKAANNWSSLASRIYPIQQVATVDGNPVYNYDLGVTDVSTLTDLQVAALPSGDVLEFAEGVTYMQGQISGYEEVILPSTFTGFSDTQPINAATTTLTSKATTPPSVDRNNLGGSGLTAIYVPAASVDTYKAASGWSTHSSIIQAIPVPAMCVMTLQDDSVVEIPYDGVGVLDENNVPYDDIFNATDIHITSYATAIGQPYELDGAYYGVFEGDGSFQLLKTVTIDEGLTAIPNQAFASNLGLTTVSLPSTITSIGDYAFGASDGGDSHPYLTSLTIHATTPPTLGTDAIFIQPGKVRPPVEPGKIYVPASAVDTYKAAAGWSNWAQYIEAIPSE